jgi:hypothetical protein
MDLNSVTKADIERMLNEKRKSLSTVSCRHILKVLRAGFQDLLANDKVTKNPAAFVRLGEESLEEIQKKEHQHSLTPDDAAIQKILEAAEGDRFQDIFVMAAMTGAKFLAWHGSQLILRIRKYA